MINFKTPMGSPSPYADRTATSIRVKVDEADRKKYIKDGEDISIGLKKLCKDKDYGFIGY